MPPWHSAWETREDNTLGGHQQSDLATSLALYPLLPRWLWEFSHRGHRPGGTLEKLTQGLGESLLEDV